MTDSKHLASAEDENLMVANKESRNEARDKCLLSLMFHQHDLRSPSTTYGAPKIELEADRGYVPGLLRFFRSV
jgi:hypothetical protein